LLQVEVAAEEELLIMVYMLIPVKVEMLPILCPMVAQWEVVGERMWVVKAGMLAAALVGCQMVQPEGMKLITIFYGRISTLNQQLEMVDVHH
tara:strand:- start:218 stop:493 length:276 start_codon:yes stop_codon:yes gene_type:complete